MKNSPATTTATTTSAVTTAPAALATSSTQTTGPAEVGSKDDSVLCHGTPHAPIGSCETQTHSAYN